MDAQTIVNELPHAGPLVFVLFGAALLSFIWEWTANSRRDGTCDCVTLCQTKWW